MTIICMHCKRPAYRGYDAPRSKVVETRVVTGETRVRGRRELSRTVQRVRECPKCRFRWRTIEIYLSPRKRRAK